MTHLEKVPAAPELPVGASLLVPPVLEQAVAHILVVEDLMMIYKWQF